MSTGLEESARLAGAHQWAERRLFEILGGWAATTGEPEVRLMLDRHSQHCAWRAGQWWDRLPVLADVDRASLCAPPHPAAAQAADRLAGVQGAVGRLAGVYRVALPRLWAAYDRHRGAAGGPADGSALWTIGIVSTDLSADWHEGEAALQAMLVDDPAVREAAETVAALERVLASGHLTA